MAMDFAEKIGRFLLFCGNLFGTAACFIGGVSLVLVPDGIITQYTLIKIVISSLW